MAADNLRVTPLDGIELRPAVRTNPRPFVALAIAAAVGLGWITRPPAPLAHWVQVALPESSVNVESLIATPSGFAVASGAGRTGGAVWTSSDGRSWVETAVPRAPTRIVADGDDLVGYDARKAFRITDDTITEIALPDLLRTGYGSGRPGLVPGRRSLIAHTVMGDVYRSFEGNPFVLTVNAHRWRTATDITLGSRCSPPERTGPDLPPVVVTEAGFHAYVAADDASGVWPICEPIAWTSGDGSIWKQESARSPFGVGAYLTDLDATDDRFVAVGGTGPQDPGVWISDDGLAWERIEAPDAPEPYELVAVDGGSTGWIAVAKWVNRPGHTSWISSDGTTWERLPDEITGRSVAVGPASILVADRSKPGRAWLGTPTIAPEQ